MLRKVESKGYKNNIGPDFLEDDPTALNYLALAYAVAGYEDEKHKIYYPTISKICSAFKLYDANEYIKEKTNSRERQQMLLTRKEMLEDKRPVCVEDLETGEILEFKNASRVSAYFKKQCGFFSKYVKNRSIYKNKYVLYRKGDRPTQIDISSKKSNNSKEVSGKNIKTGETRIFSSMQEAADYIKKSQSQVSYLTRSTRTTKCGWKFEIIKQVGNSGIIE